MTQPIPIYLAVEDVLSEAVVLKLVQASNRPYHISTVYNQGGYGYIKRTIKGFNNAAKGAPFFVLTDLDSADCPPELIEAWIDVPIHANLMFRVAVKEVEAWLLADPATLSNFLSVNPNLVPSAVEAIADPKAALIDLARRSSRKEIREDIVPPTNSARKVGPNYNARLVAYVSSSWNPNVASQNSRSLLKALNRLQSFTPTWQS
jgi:hypothetical protein